MVKFTKTQAIPLSRFPAKVVVRWEVDASTQAQLYDYEFCVARQRTGENSRGDFQNVDIDGNPITPRSESLDVNVMQNISTWIDGLDFPWFIDYSEVLTDLTSMPTYIVKCRNKKTQEEVVSSPFTFEGDIDLVGLYIVDEHNFLLRDVTGVPSLIYKRKRGGVHCKECFDPIQNKRTRSNCKSCYGTNWLGGFFSPIDCYIDYNPNPKASGISEFGEVQENETNALMSNFPNMNPGDVIREIRDMRMWRVVNVTVTEKRRCQMLQFLRLAEIKPADIEYQLMTDERFLVKKVEELEKIKKKVEF